MLISVSKTLHLNYLQFWAPDSLLLYLYLSISHSFSNLFLFFQLLITLTAALLTNGVHGAMRCHHDIKMRNRDAYTGNDYTLYKEYYGYYKRQPGKINGRAWYKSNTGRSKIQGLNQADDLAIWRFRGGWAIGPESWKGTKIGLFFTREDERCPTDPAFWKYYNPATGEWENTGMYLHRHWF